MPETMITRGSFSALAVTLATMPALAQSPQSSMPLGAKPIERVAAARA